jgi:tRNA (guanine37-N1)-methyltransferase
MPRLLKEALKNILKDEELREVYSALDIIGDIAILKIPDKLLDKKHIIGEAVLNSIKHVRTVYMQSSAVKDAYRIRELECIAGIDDPITIYKEHGCRFKVNVKTTYFSPRLSTERLRIAELVRDGEIIVNMFAGIGTFSIIIAKKKRCRVYSIDLNPEAHRYATENIRLNKVEDRVVPLLGDARAIIRDKLKGIADRVLMPLPEEAREFIDDALLALKDQGIIHYFTHLHANNKQDAIVRCKDEVYKMMDNKCRYNIDNVRVVRAVGPRFYQLVADINIDKSFLS